MHKYIAHQQQNGAFTISRDGYTCNCPKSTIVVPVQAINGVQMQPQQLPCSTHCPFASIIEKNGFVPAEETGSTPVGKKSYYIIGCEGQNMEIELNEIKLNKSQSNGLIAK